MQFSRFGPFKTSFFSCAFLQTRFGHDFQSILLHFVLHLARFGAASFTREVPEGIFLNPVLPMWLQRGPRCSKMIPRGSKRNLRCAKSTEILPRCGSRTLQIATKICRNRFPKTSKVHGTIALTLQLGGLPLRYRRLYVLYMGQWAAPTLHNGVPWPRIQKN